jgi:hypothetical protein
LNLVTKFPEIDILELVPQPHETIRIQPLPIFQPYHPSYLDLTCLISFLLPKVTKGLLHLKAEERCIERQDPLYIYTYFLLYFFFCGTGV